MKQVILVIIILALLAGGCAISDKKATSPKLDSPDSDSSGISNSDDDFGLLDDELAEQAVKVADPLEPLNRTMYGINDVLYFWVVKPVTHTYKAIAPKPVRIGIGNFFDNLTTPARFANCLLQGKNQAAETELHRFAVNTTAGVLGFGDPAQDRYDLKPADEDLGQTLAVHGLGDGFYVVWPLLGPSTLRDSAGMVGDWFLNPVKYVKPDEVSLGISAVNFTNNGSFRTGEYEAFKEAAVDPYVAMRNAYIQYRSKQIKE